MVNRFDLRWASLTAAWALGYGGLRLWWAFGHRPGFRPLGWDLLVVSPWQPVLVCALALLAVATMLAAPRRWLPPVGCAALAVVAVLSCPLTLLDLVGAVLPGLGLPHDPAATASRAGYLLGAVLLAVAAVRRSRTLRGACLRCGRTDRSRPAGRVPAWAWLGAYLAVAGCLTRLGAQLVAGFGAIPLRSGPAQTGFEAGFLLAGTLLPLATVYRWGRVWPRWVPGLAGHRVPRWLVLGPATVLAAGLVVYFGIGLAQLVADPGAWTADGSYPLAFFWVAIPAYVLWGLGLAAGARWYRRATRPRCPRCGRGAPAPYHRPAPPARTAPARPGPARTDPARQAEAAHET